MTVARNSVFVLVPRVVGIAAALLSAVVSARYLGPSGRGLLSLAMLLVGVLYFLADVGVTRSMAYFVSGERLSPRHGLALATLATLVLAGGLALVAVLLGPVLRDSVLVGMETRVYLAAVAGLPALYFSNVWVSLSWARRAFRAAALYQVVLAVGTLAVMVLVLVVLDLGLFELVLAHTAFTTTLAVYLWVSSAITQGVAWRLPPGLLGQIASYGGRSYAGAIFDYTTMRIDAFILNAFAGSASVGYYTLATNVTETMWAFDMALAKASMPEVVSRVRREAAQLVAATVRNLILLTGAISVALAAAAPWLVVFLFGQDFAPAAVPMRILLPGVVLLGAGRLLMQYFQGQLGRPGITSLVSGVAAAASVGLYFALVPTMAEVGAALASTIVYAGVFVVMLVLFLRETDLGVVEVLVPRLEDVRRYPRLAVSMLQGQGADAAGADAAGDEPGESETL